jgi:ATP:cob(I)alamin adenosyltransferase
VSIYTRRGDAGQTTLLSGELVDKDDARVQTYGAVDELQAHLGMVIALTRSARVRSLLEAVEEDMVAVCAELASSGEPGTRLSRRVGRDDAARLERAIDDLTASYRLPHGFVRPGASPDSAAAHVARAVSRRCERLIVALDKRAGGLDDLVVYFNRLSDFLFVVAWSLEVEGVLDDIVSESVERAGAHGADGGGGEPMSRTLTLPLARLLGDEAEAEAAAVGVPVTVAVVDGEAGLVYLARMDDALPASRDLAVAKAQTAASLRMATDEVGRLAQPGAPLYGIQHVQPGRVVLFGGGLPLRLGGTVVGGIGVSGGTVEADVQIAGSVVEALAEMERWAGVVERSAPPGNANGHGPTHIEPALRAAFSGMDPPLPAREQSILAGAVVLGLAATPDRAAHV